VLCISANDPPGQLREVISAAGITHRDVSLLHRCIICNEHLQQLPRNDAFGSVPDYIFETHVDFFQCPDCQRVYWRGSHSNRMQDRLHDMLGWSV
jgi:uncharacterized protein